MNATHAFNRINERVNDPMLARNLYTVASRIAPTLRDCVMHGDACTGHAVRLYVANESNGRMTFNPDGTGESNGNHLYAIVRNGTLYTMMWRRYNQPATLAALRVSHIGKVK